MPDDDVVDVPEDDDELSHEVPADLVELHEVLEWQAAGGKS